MARPRFSKLQLPRREAILRAAAEEFAERGYEGASTARIAERSGMSKGSLYYYFEDKADILATVLEHTLERVTRELDAPAPSDLTAEDFWERLREVGLRFLELARTDELWLRLLRTVLTLSRTPDTEPAIRSVVEFSRSWWQETLARGQVLGVVRSDLPLQLLTEIAMGADEAGDRWMLAHWEDFDADELRALAEARIDLVRDMLDARKEGWEG